MANGRLYSAYKSAGKAKSSYKASLSDIYNVGLEAQHSKGMADIDNKRTEDAIGFISEGLTLTSNLYEGHKSKEQMSKISKEMGAEVQKQSALNQQKAELIQMEAELEVNKMKEEKELKKELMLYEFRLAKEMQKVQNEGLQNKEKYKEDRKDERTKIQASQQSELIEQRAGKQGKKVFESAGNDTMGSGFNMEMFEPR